ncbi:MAG: YceI family protein [Gemmatimonadales bacterium]
MTASAPSSATTWTLDVTHTLVEFAVKHLMITTVKGRFGGVTGSITLAGDQSAATVDIDAASIDTRVEQRDEHLRSADFLDVANHPTLTFRSKRVEGTVAKAGDSFRLIGDLTIRGVTREVALDTVFEGEATDPWGGSRASFSATTRIDRRDFGLTWNQALESGGVLVANEVKISLEVQATRA